MMRSNIFSRGAETKPEGDFEEFLKGDADLEEALVGGSGLEEVSEDDEEPLTSFDE